MNKNKLNERNIKECVPTKGLTILLKEIDYDSGVKVSVQHLGKVLEETDISYEIMFYENDQDLIKKAKESNYSCLNLHVPSFQDDTLQTILSIHNNVVLSIHSTMCNLQVEENGLNRMLTMGDGSFQGLRFTCPSQREVDGFNAVLPTSYYYLPNTFSYESDEKMIDSLIQKKVETLEKRPVKISLISAYRPMKNMITQMAAIIKLAKERDLELHLMDTKRKTPVYYNVLKMAKDNGLKVVLHPQTSNYDLYRQMAQFDIGMQVSLTETFSYVAFEHMIQGIPVLGSHSVPFSTKIADYSDVNDIYHKLKEIISCKETYQQCSQSAYTTALNLQEENKRNAISTIRTIY